MLGKRLAHARANPVEALVARYRREPDVPLPRLAPGEQGSIGRDERLLHGVLCLGRVREQASADREHHPRVLPEELARKSGRSVIGRVPLEQ